MKEQNYIDLFRDFLASKRITQKDVVDKWNKVYPDKVQTYQNLNNKLRHNTLRWSEALTILAMYGYKVEFIQVASTTTQETETGVNAPTIKTAAKRATETVRLKEYVKRKEIKE